jgi:WD40 repeat protein
LLWKDGKGEASVVPGFGHTNQVTNFSSDGDLMYSAGMDDTVKTLSLAGGEAK